jgi:ribonuclease P protein component
VIEASGHGGGPEVGVVAGKHVGNAVRRNRAKRRLRAAAELTPWRAKRAYVLVASKETPDVAFGDLVVWLQQAAATTSRSAGDQR